MGDFSGQNLRGRNFRGQDLHAVSFSYADIQGANFSGANLQDADFSGARAGLQKRYVAVQMLLACLMCGLCGLLVGYFSSWFSFYFEVDYINKYGLRPGIAYVYSLGMIIIAIVCYGFTTKTLLAIGISNVSVVALATIIGITSVETYEAVSIAVVGIATLSIGVAVGVAGSSSSAIANAANNKTIKWISILAAACTGILGGVSGAVAGGRSGASNSFGVAAGNVSIVCAIVVSVVPNLLGIYISWRVMRDDNKFALIRKFAIVFSSLGGTRFYRANLTGAKFANAILENTNLCAANLTHVYWKNACNLHRARLGTSILADRKVLDLLTTGYGVNQDLSNLNLRGTNLDSATLNGANLKNTDFSQARLRQVDLQNANLTELQAIGTDFTEAYLTGACIEAWNIDQANITAIHCDFYFLRETADSKGSRDRRPHDPNRIYASGDAEKILTEALNIVEVLLKQCTNAQDLAQALQQITVTYPKATLQGLDRKDARDFLVTLTVPTETDKAQVETALHKAYDEIRALRGEVKDLQTLRAADMKDVVTALANRPAPPVNLNQNINQNTGDNPMTTQDNQAIATGANSNINFGTQTGNTLNFGTISGNLTNSLTQLATQPQTQAIAAHLKEFQTAIETDSHLPEPDKIDALEQVAIVATASQDPTTPENISLTRKAMKLLKGTIDAVPKATSFIEACTKLLPLIGQRIC